MTRTHHRRDTTTGETVLDIRGLRTTFNTGRGAAVAVDGVDLTIRAGETLCVVGESGSGKSVTALSVMGLLGDNAHIDASSRILLAGTDVTKLGSRALRRVRGRDVAMIFQEPMTALDPVYTVGAQIRESVRQHEKLSRKQADARVLELMQLVGIPSPQQRAKDYPHQMSGGMRQRIMIACALSSRPKVLIADEPTTALDVTIQAQVLELMRDLQAELGMAIMLITHDLGVVAEMADQVAVMYAGRVVETGTVDEVFTSPRHPYSQALLASVPRLGMDRSAPLPTIPGTVPSLLTKSPGCRFAARCPHVLDRCLVEAPPVFDVGGQSAACWLHADDLPATDAVVEPLPSRKEIA